MNCRIKTSNKLFLQLCDDNGISLVNLMRKFEQFCKLMETNCIFKNKF